MRILIVHQATEHQEFVMFPTVPFTAPKECCQLSKENMKKRIKLLECSQISIENNYYGKNINFRGIEFEKKGGLEKSEGLEKQYYWSEENKAKGFLSFKEGTHEIDSATFRYTYGVDIDIEKCGKYFVMRLVVWPNKFLKKMSSYYILNLLREGYK